MDRREEIDAAIVLRRHGLFAHSPTHVRYTSDLQWCNLAN
jgi:hypothetical protein